MYSDAYIERWAEPFMRLRLRRRLDITFEEFLSDPGHCLSRVPTHPLED